MGELTATRTSRIVAVALLFDPYVASRTPTELELRVRSAANGPVWMRMGGTETCLPEPAVSYQGQYFYRHAFRGLPSGTELEIEVRQDAADLSRTLSTRTLPPLPGIRKMRLGLLADLHLTLDRRHIDDYRPGTKRLCGLSLELAERYLERLELLGAEAIVLLGDVVDPCTRESLAVLRSLLERREVPCYPIIGNHEPWSRGGAALFHEALDLPRRGYYAVCRPGLRLLMLSTPSPDALHPDGAQYRWLVEQLGDAGEDEDIVLFSHFSLVLHHCVEGSRNDGYQLLDAHRKLLDLIGRFANVRLVSAGHKNVPSCFLSGHTLHLLSPQLIQAPCGYDLLDLCEGGLARITYEIDEQHYAEVARAAYAREGPLRFGTDEDRCFVWRYPER